MIVIGDSKTYKIGDKEKTIHLPRIYINDIKAVRSILQLLKQKKRLTNQTMTEETTRVRSENIREFFQVLWELKIGVEVLLVDNKITYIPNSKLDDILKLNDENLKKFVLERLLSYNPFVAILDKLVEYKDKKKTFTQKNIADDFHEMEKRGNLDNVHPLLRWANDFGLVDKTKVITERGEKFVEKAEKLDTCYIHYSFDLKDNVGWNIITHILSNQPKAQNMTFNEIQEQLDKIPYAINIEKTLTELSELGVPIKVNFNRKKILLKSKIIHSITSKFYTKCKLQYVDEITEYSTQNITDYESLILGDICEVLIISDQVKIDLKNYPANSKTITYDQFSEIENKLPSLSLKMIIISSCWKPLKIIEKISGTLIAFSRMGGVVVVENINVYGRTGSNPNRYVWLPHDLSHISSVPIKDKKFKGYFKFGKEKFTFSKKIEQQEIKNNTGKYCFLKIQYHDGLFILTTMIDNKQILESVISKTPKFSIDETDIQWVERGTINPKKDTRINNERALYPVLRRKMQKYFGFKFDPEIVGNPGQTDIMIVKPFLCCCEVSSFTTNVTASNKVSEVVGHRKAMKRKYKNQNQHQNQKINALVFGNSFSDEDGKDKQGSINMAEASDVTLMSYTDLYELICINEKSRLDENELEDVFCYKNQPLVHERLYNLAKKKRIL